jgi:hypothetical protein
MIFMRILPSALKELSKHVPTILFKVVDWGELASELPKLSRRILKKEDYPEFFKKQKAWLSPLKIELTELSQDHSNLSVTKEVAEKFLTLYFAQLYSPHGIFLDLRSENFTSMNDQLLWNPTGLWTQFDEKFRGGLMKIYDGFYLEDENLYQQGLLESGLLKEDWPQADKKKIGNIFKEQFGSSLTTEMTFELEHFKKSIFRTSDFLLSKKVTITKDFLYLGIYLVTLYSTLEQCPEKLAVKDMYLKVRANFT